MQISANRTPHSTERENEILELLELRGFVSFRELEKEIGASPATLRRDLERLSLEGRLTRVHGGAKRKKDGASAAAIPGLQGVPFHENIGLHPREKEAIGRA